MKIVLRVVAVVIGLAVILTAVMIVQFANTGGFVGLAGSGLIGITTIGASALILLIGPVATIYHFVESAHRSRDALWHRRRLLRRGSLSSIS